MATLLTAKPTTPSHIAVTQMAKPATVAVFGPGPKCGRIAAYHHVISIPNTKKTLMKNSDVPMPVVLGRKA